MRFNRRGIGWVIFTIIIVIAAGGFKLFIDKINPVYTSNGLVSPRLTFSEANQPLYLQNMANPAAIYCRELGYEYRVTQGKNGSVGECVLPEGVCDEWDFLNGKCGQEFNYCAQLGMETEVNGDGKNSFSPEYAVCTSEDKTSSKAVSELFGLDQKSLKSSCSQDDLIEELPTILEVEPTATKSPTVQAPIVSSSATVFVHLPFIMNSLASSFDWRDYQGGNWLTPVRNQGSCGSCWAFSVIGVTEAALNIANNNPDLDLDLSEQYLISNCDTLSGSCCGGYQYYTLYSIKYDGVPDEACMSYTDGFGGRSCSCDNEVCTCTYNGSGICSNRTCEERCSDWSSRLQYINSFGFVPENIIKQQLKDYGPLSAAMNWDVYGGWFDANGIYHCSDDTSANHGVVIVGYNDAGGYWIVRNSWGSTWNGDGYFKIGYGECYIENEVTYGSAAE